MTAIKPVLIEPKDKWFRYVGIGLSGEDACAPGMRMGTSYSRSIPTKLLLIPGYIKSENGERVLVRGFCNQNNIGGEVFIMDNDTVLQQLVLDRTAEHDQQASTHLYAYSHGRAAVLKYDSGQLMEQTHKLREGQFSYTALNGAGNVLISYRLSVSEDEGDFILTPTWTKGSKIKNDIDKPNVAKFLTKIKDRLEPIYRGVFVETGHDEFTDVSDFIFGDKFDKLSKVSWIPYQVCHAFLKLIRFLNDWEEEQGVITGADSQALQAILQECRDTVQKWYCHLHSGSLPDEFSPQTVANMSRFVSMMANARALRRTSAQANIGLATSAPDVYMRECAILKISPGRQTGKTSWAIDLVKNAKSGEAVILLLAPHSREFQHLTDEPVRMITTKSVFLNRLFQFREHFDALKGPFTLIIDDAFVWSLSEIDELQKLVYMKMIQAPVEQRHEFEIILLG